MAVYRGLMEKPAECEACGVGVEACDLEGHHHNGYENALQVKWLCRKCHQVQHVA